MQNMARSSPACQLEHDRLGRLGTAGVELGRQRAHGRVAEQHRQCAHALEMLLDLVDELDAEQRVAAEVEEVIIEADVLDAQHALPDRRQRAL